MFSSHFWSRKTAGVLDFNNNTQKLQNFSFSSILAIDLKYLPESCRNVQWLINHSDPYKKNSISMTFHTILFSKNQVLPSCFSLSSIFSRGEQSVKESSSFLPYPHRENRHTAAQGSPVALVLPADAAAYLMLEKSTFPMTGFKSSDRLRQIYCEVVVRGTS